MSTFRGIEIGRSAISTHKLALDVVAQNVASANVSGYSRQSVQMKAVSYAQSGLSDVQKFTGAGVTVERVARLRDAFLDKQIRQETATKGWADARLETLNQVEVVMNELESTGIRARLDEFWNALQELSLNPESVSVRATVVQRGEALCEAFRHTVEWLRQLQENLNYQIQTTVGRINDIASQLAELNDQIVRARARGECSNLLEDRRDLLIDELSEFGPVDVTVRTEGAAIIKLGGFPIVDAYGLEKLEFQAVGASGYPVVTWGPEGRVLQIGTGRLKGLLEARDELAASYIEDLNQLARSIVDEVNALHRKGYGLDGTTTGLDFFVMGKDASDLQVREDILKNPSLVAASASGEPGDGSNALAMAQLKQKTLMVNATATWDDYIRSITARLGIETQEAKRVSENQELLLKDLENRRESVSGVSLDEEATEMIKLQHAYNAAARLITAYDELLEVLISRTGLVGR
ncbi:MAG: flagellar hook-associated protein FlgK [Bacillota bacterium]